MKQETQLTHLSGLPLPAQFGGAIGAPAPSQGQPEQPLRKVHRMLRGRYILALALLVVGATIGAIWGWRSDEPTYRSRGYIEFSPYLTVDVKEMDVVMPAFQEYVRTQAHDLASQRIINHAMNMPEWQARGWKDEERASDPLRHFSENLTVEPVRGTWQIEVAFNDPDPTVAQAAVKSVLLAYLELAPDSGADRLDLRIEELRKRIEKARAQIRRNQEQINRLALEQGADDHAEIIRTLQTRQAQYHADLIVAQLRRAAAETALTARQENREAAELTMSELANADATGQLRQLLQQQIDLENELELMLRTYADNHRLVQNKRAEIELVKKHLQNRSDELRGEVAAIQMGPDGQPVLLNEQYIEQLKMQEQFQANLLQQVKEEVSRFNKMQTDLRTLREQIASLEQDMVNDQKAMDDIVIAKSLSGERTVRSYGERPVKPHDDDRPKFAAVGVILGGGLPLGLLLLVGLLDHRYRYSDDTADSSMSGVTLLGILPNLPDLLTDPEQAAIAAHCVHQIRTMLQVNSGTEEPRCYTVTSADSGDGKTSLCLAMGLSFAASGSRTLLIDADLVGAGLSSRLNMTSSEGILDALAARSLLPFVRTTDIDGLSVLPVGAAMGHHASLLAPAAVRKLIAEAKRHYETVLVDTGPILGSIEASAVAAAADGVVLCVARGQQRPLVEKSLSHLLAIGARLAGVVFNRAMGKDFQDSISRMSTRSVRHSHRIGNGHGSTNRDGGHIGPVARAVASSVRHSDRRGNGHGEESSS